MLTDIIFLASLDAAGVVFQDTFFEFDCELRCLRRHRNHFHFDTLIPTLKIGNLSVRNVGELAEITGRLKFFGKSSQKRFCNAF
jgi:hypothetical protein